MNRNQVLQRNFLDNLDAAKYRADEHPVDAPREPMTPEDKLNSLAHMINDIGQNHGHARNHTVSMMKFLHQGDTDAALQNADHAQKHMLHAEEAAKKLGAHIKAHFPEVVQELQELHNADPFSDCRS